MARCRRIPILALGWLLSTVTLGHAVAQQEAAPVAVAQAEMARVIDEVPITGTVTSPRSARLSMEVDGLVEEVHVEAGDRVEADAVLVTLGSELARRELERLEAYVRHARVELADARRRLNEAEALERQSIPETEVESRQAAVEGARATLAQRRAQRELQSARLERHTLEAPFAGVISRKLTAPGEWVAPGSVLLELVDLADLRIDYAVPQEAFARLSTETPIRVRPAGHSEAVSGRIRRIVAVTDEESRSFIIHAVPEEELAMSPGMSAQGLLRLTTQREAVVVPRDALIRSPSGRTTVWVLDRSAEPPVARERRVAVGTSFGDRIALEEGLEAGETVVVRGNTRLQEGQVVSIQP